MLLIHFAKATSQIITTIAFDTPKRFTGRIMLFHRTSPHCTVWPVVRYWERWLLWMKLLSITKFICIQASETKQYQVHLLC